MANIPAEGTQKGRLNTFLKRYYKDFVAVAVLTLIFVALTNRWAIKGKNEEGVEHNARAVATIMVYDSDHNIISQGSGFFIDSAGLLVTNAHVINRMSYAVAKLSTGAFYQLKETKNINRDRDVAILQFDAKETPSVTGLGNSDELRVGEKVYAIGTPEEQESTVSMGNISNPNQELGGKKFIQFTAPISPGSSGGGLFDEDGRVIGITSESVNPREGPQAGLAQNLNYAVPINDVKSEIQGSGNVSKGNSGFYFAEGTLAENRHNWDKAIDNYSKATELDSNNADAYIGLGNVYFSKGDYDLELKSYLAATVADSENPDAYHALATAYEDVQEYRLADKCFYRALSLDPNNKEIIHDYAILCLAEADKKDASILIDRLAKLDPGWGRVLHVVLTNTK